MERPTLRRIKMDDHPNRGDVQYVLFEAGYMSRPICILTQSQMVDLIDQYNTQEANHADVKPSRRTVRS